MYNITLFCNIYYIILLSVYSLYDVHSDVISVPLHFTSDTYSTDVEETFGFLW